MSQWSEFAESDLDVDSDKSEQGEGEREREGEGAAQEKQAQAEEEEKRKKKKKKGPFVGDVRMAIYTLDVGNEYVTFVGTIDKNNTLNKFISPVSNKEYISLKYGKVSKQDCFVDYQTENVYTLYFLRGLSLLMSIGLFVSFAHILGYFVSFFPGKLNIRFGHLYGIPFVAYSSLFGFIFWIIIVSISWFIPQKEIAWILLGLIFIIITILHFLTSKKLAQLFELANKEYKAMMENEKAKTE